MCLIWHVFHWHSCIMFGSLNKFRLGTLQFIHKYQVPIPNTSNKQKSYTLIIELETLLLQHCTYSDKFEEKCRRFRMSYLFRQKHTHITTLTFLILFHTLENFLFFHHCVSGTSSTTIGLRLHNTQNSNFRNTRETKIHLFKKASRCHYPEPIARNCIVNRC